MSASVSFLVTSSALLALRRELMFQLVISWYFFPRVNSWCADTGKTFDGDLRRPSSVCVLDSSMVVSKVTSLVKDSCRRGAVQGKNATPTVLEHLLEDYHSRPYLQSCFTSLRASSCRECLLTATIRHSLACPTFLRRNAEAVLVVVCHALSRQ